MLSWRKDAGAKKDADAPQAPQGGAPAAPAVSSSSTGSPAGSTLPTQAPSSPSPSSLDTETLEHPRHRLGTILVQEGVITQAQLEEALAKKEVEGGFLGQTLVDLKYIHRETLISFLVKQCKIPHLSLLDYQFNEELFKYIAKDTCLKYNLLPIDRLGKILTVAMVDPLDIEALEAVRTACPELKIKPILCDWYHYETIARRVLENPTERGEETASSFGLSERAKPAETKPPEPAPAPKAAPPPARPPIQDITPAAPPPPEAKPAPHVATGPSSDEVAAVLRQTARETMQETVSGIVEAVRSSLSSAAPAPGPSAEALAAAVGESVRGAMRDVVTQLEERIQKPEASAPAPVQSSAEFAAIVRDGLREALAGMQVPQANAPAIAPAGPSAEALAAAVGASVREAMRDVVSQLGERSEQTAPPGPDLAVILRDGIREAIAGMETARGVHESGPSAEDLAAVVRDGIREAVTSLDATRANAAKEKTPKGPSSEELAAAVGESVREAMRDVVTQLDERMQKASAPVEAQPSAADIAAVVRDGIREAVTSLDAARANAAKEKAPKGPSSEELAAAVGESVRGAMRDVVTQLDERMQKASTPVEAPPSVADIAAVLRDGIREAILEVTPVLAANASKPSPTEMIALEQAREALAQQEARLNEVAEAASQAAKAAEAASLEKSQQRGKLETERRRKHASVAPLKGKEQEALEAIDGPGLRSPADDRVHEALDSERPLGAYTFDGYIVGKANTFTVAMGKAVAERPGGEYNPFFLYGDVGIGKTHLINAIGNHILSKTPEQRVGYVSSSRFASAIVEAIQEHELDAFRENYCHWDVLILDDIQFMGGRLEAQEEFFHIFNALHQEGRQIIIAGDKPPDQLGQLEKRLVSRFAGGIVANLRPPEWETRMAILRRQASDSKVKVPEEVLSLIATRVPNDVRKMSGSLRKVAAFASLVGQEVTCDLATEILSHLGLNEVA